ncbi:MAG: phosphoribosylglycinamide formyltransferase [Armatimonadetes bacterium]|jgi:phosphoribosylglycinamide formyltransferase-1|nr:phosphoribosylglycinamide formyltransferase [Armatimonadota bacterium]
MASTNAPLRLAVLLSGQGRGSTLQAFLDAAAAGRLPAQVAVVLSTTPGTPAIARARAAGVPALELEVHDVPDGEALDARLLEALAPFQPDLICLTGFMRRLGSRFCQTYRWRILNSHPALIPAFCGKGMYGHHVHEAVLAYGVKVSGCTIHFVNEEYDAGPVVTQRCVPVCEDDTPATLAARILPEEHQAYVEAIRLFAEGRLRVVGRRVEVLGAK